MTGNYVTVNAPNQVQVVVISYANAITEDWYVPDDASGSPSEVDLWLNDPPAGAGYTTQKMIDAAIHQGDATFSDGSVKGLKLTSASATFTQADIGCVITGSGYGLGNSIIKWLSPTQVILRKRLRNGTGAAFTLNARKDGLIDVAMAACPSQYITTAVGGNGQYLDAAAAGSDPDPGTYLARTVDNMAWSLYGHRYVVQRNNVTAISDTKDLAADAWVILANAANAGWPTAGQAVGACWADERYRMNGGDGNNCDHDNPGCEPVNPPWERETASLVTNKF